MSTATPVPAPKPQPKPQRSRWFKLTWIVPLVIVGAALIVLAANGIRSLPAVTDFTKSYPGQSALPSWAPVGFPVWLEWQHFLNGFFLLFIVRTGWQVHTTRRAEAYWTRNNKGLIKTKGQPVRIPLHLWFHLTMDVLFVLNGIVFFVLIFVTGQWVRIVPTRWDVIPNAITAALDYASLHWPTEDGWVNYNALQLLSYFVVVFIAAPLAILTGLRMVPGLAGRWKPFDRVYPARLARALHYPIFLFFLAFIVVHVTLVLATGALRNLNHMYGASDQVNWVGFAFFAGSLVLMVGGWFAARPVLLASLASLGGRVGR
jgi:thiosulfate reductase cytochrome b subunit